MELGEPQSQTKDVNLFQGDAASLGPDLLPDFIRPAGLSAERKKYLEKEVWQLTSGTGYIRNKFDNSVIF